MITKEIIKEQAEQYQRQTGWDDKCRMSFTTGAHWAKDEILKDIQMTDEVNPLTNIDSLLDEVSGRLIQMRENPDAKALLDAFFVLKKNLIGADKKALLHEYLLMCKMVLPFPEFEDCTK